MKYSLSLACLLMLGCLGAATAQTPLLGVVKGQPDVAKVEVAVPASEGRYIVHIRDWHWVSFDDLKAEIPETTIDDYLDFLDDVTAVQAEQYRILKRLIVRRDVAVFREGLTPETQEVIASLSRAVWSARKAKPDDITLLILTPNVLTLGSPSRLLADGHLETVHALDTDESMSIANPFDADGNLRDVPQSVIEQREDIMVGRILKAKSTPIVVLGGAHDLRDNVRRLGKGVGLIVVTTKQYQKVAEE